MGYAGYIVNTREYKKTIILKDEVMKTDRLYALTLYASRIKIDAFCGNTPQIPIGMTEEIPETSRLLDALEKKYREEHHLMANALSFGGYGKAGGSHV